MSTAALSDATTHTVPSHDRPDQDIVMPSIPAPKHRDQGFSSQSRTKDDPRDGRDKTDLAHWATTSKYQE